MRAEERKREKYLPTLLIQQIRLQWYNDCRGGNAAAQRNQYPRAMRLPMEVATEQYGFCPDIVDQEQDDPTVGNLADVLRQSTVWYFWWD